MFASQPFLGIDPPFGRASAPPRRAKAKGAAQARARRADTGQTPVAGGRDGVTVSFPDARTVRFTSSTLFRDNRSAFARAFFARAFQAPGVAQVAIDSEKHTADIVYERAAKPGEKRLAALSKVLSNPVGPLDGADGPVVPEELPGPTATALRLQRHGQRLSTWTVHHEVPGRIRLYNPLLYRRRELCQAVERECMNTFGIDRYSTNEFTSTVLVAYDPKQLQKHQILEILDGTLANAHELPIAPVDLDLPICTASVALALGSAFLIPALAPLSAAVFLYSVLPSFKSAYRVLRVEKRLEPCSVSPSVSRASSCSTPRTTARRCCSTSSASKLASSGGTSTA
jgi:hypothetical protein